MAAKFIINRNDITETLKTLNTQETKNWMPILKMSNLDEQEIITRENWNTKPC